MISLTDRTTPFVKTKKYIKMPGIISSGPQKCPLIEQTIYVLMMRKAVIMLMITQLIQYFSSNQIQKQNPYPVRVISPLLMIKLRFTESDFQYLTSFPPIKNQKVALMSDSQVSTSNSSLIFKKTVISTCLLDCLDSNSFSLSIFYEEVYLNSHTDQSPFICISLIHQGQFQIGSATKIQALFGSFSQRMLSPIRPKTRTQTESRYIFLFFKLKQLGCSRFYIQILLLSSKDHYWMAFQSRLNQLNKLIVWIQLD